VELDALRTQLATKWKELGQMESQVSKLTTELTSARSQLTTAVDKNAANDVTISTLSEQKSRLQREVGVGRVDRGTVFNSSTQPNPMHPPNEAEIPRGSSRHVTTRTTCRDVSRAS